MAGEIVYKDKSPNANDYKSSFAFSAADYISGAVIFLVMSGGAAYILKQLADK